jgi:hypothetical protein
MFSYFSTRELRFVVWLRNEAEIVYSLLVDNFTAGAPPAFLIYLVGARQWMACSLTLCYPSFTW